MTLETFKIKVLGIDVDGIMTNGTKLYDRDAKCIAKQYNDRDFTAIRRLKDAGIYVCLISGDRNINEEMASKRNIDFYYVNVHTGSKVDTMEGILKERGLTWKDAAYIGDDYFDLPLLTKVCYAYCSSDSIIDIKYNPHVKMLSGCGGTGVLDELYKVLRSVPCHSIT